MFKQLRNRFLMLHMVIITITMLLAFIVIYLITFQNIRWDIYREIDRVSDFHGPLDKTPPDFLHSLKDFPQNPPERSVTFFILLDKEENIIAIHSRFNLESAFYTQATKKAMAHDKARGDFKLDGANWIYLKKPIPEGTFLVVMDITAQQAILNNLIYTFMTVAGCMLIAIFFISRFFANRSIAPIQDSYEKQKQFVSDASHELKTPLTVINANLDVILANQESKVQDQIKWLRYIQSETQRMAKLTNDLLYLTRMDDKAIQMASSEFNLSDLTWNIVLTMEALIYEQGLTLETNIKPQVLAYGNPEQIGQVLLILLDNAVKYTNPQGTIEITLQEHDKQALLQVKNTGQGIAPAHLHRIFDRFYRTDASRERTTGGYGLGLAIAQATIEKNSGHIQVHSKEGKFTVFTITLPKHHKDKRFAQIKKK